MNQMVTISKQEYDKLVRRVEKLERHFGAVKKSSLSHKTDIQPDGKSTSYMTRALKQAKKEVERGFVSPGFDKASDAIAWLKDPKAKYANQIRKEV